jgi:hypothetical protein
MLPSNSRCHDRIDFPNRIFRSVAKTLELAVKTMAFMKPWVQKLHCFTHLATSASETAMFESSPRY